MSDGVVDGAAPKKFAATIEFRRTNWELMFAMPPPAKVTDRLPTIVQFVKPIAVCKGRPEKAAMPPPYERRRVVRDRAIDEARPLERLLSNAAAVSRVVR